MKRGDKAEVVQIPFDDDDDESMKKMETLIDDEELFSKLIEDKELLDELIEPLDIDRVLDGQQTPLFFGSAMTNFGVQLFLDKFLQMGTKPTSRPLTSKDNQSSSDDSDSVGDNVVSPEYEEFTGFVFKTQANLDPKHRDRLAYVRIVSGVYEKGMKVGHSRSKAGKKFNLAQAQALFGSDRTSVDIAYPGDVIGINNPGLFAIGDTLFTGTDRIAFPGIPRYGSMITSHLITTNIYTITYALTISWYTAVI